MLGASLIILCSVLWATDAVFRLPLAQSIEPGTIILLEHALCVIATLPLFLLRKRETRAMGTRAWFAVAFLGIVGSAVGTFLFTASYQHINPSVTILLQKMQPVVAILAARVFLREKPRVTFYFWALVALLASTMISVPEMWRRDVLFQGFPSLDAQDTKRITGVAYACGAALVWGLSTVFGKWVTNKLSFPVISFLRFVFGLVGIVLLTLLGFWKTSVPLTNLYVYFASEPQAIRSVLYMALIPGVLAMYLYYAGLRRTKASMATLAELFFPAAAIAINWLILDQPLLPLQLFGTVLLLLSVLFISRGMR